MPSFSERMGYVTPPEFMQLKSMNEELSNLLGNFCIECFNSIEHSESIRILTNRIQNTLKCSYCDFSFLKRGLHIFEAILRTDTTYSLHNLRLIDVLIMPKQNKKIDAFNKKTMLLIIPQYICFLEQ